MRSSYVLRKIRKFAEKKTVIIFFCISKYSAEMDSTTFQTTHTTWAMERDYILAIDAMYSKILCRTEKLLNSAITEEDKTRIIARANDRIGKKSAEYMEQYHMERFFIPTINSTDSTGNDGN